MKELVTITLLLVHLFNLAGYPLLFRYLSIQSGKQATANIDKNKYEQEELVEIKVALNLPYVSSQGDYERYDGEIILNGVHHNYVKRKVSGDTLYLLCLPNKESDKLLEAQNEYSKKINDFNDPSQENDAPVKNGNIFNHYHQQETDYHLESPLTVNAKENINLISSLSTLFIDKDDRPPKVNS